MQCCAAAAAAAAAAAVDKPSFVTLCSAQPNQM